MGEKLTATQAAELLGYHTKHLHRLLRSGDVRGERFGPVWAVDRDEVEKVLALRAQHGRFWATFRDAE